MKIEGLLGRFFFTIVLWSLTCCGGQDITSGSSGTIMRVEKMYVKSYISYGEHSESDSADYFHAFFYDSCGGINEHNYYSLGKLSHSNICEVDKKKCNKIKETVYNYLHDMQIDTIVKKYLYNEEGDSIGINCFYSNTFEPFMTIKFQYNKQGLIEKEIRDYNDSIDNASVIEYYYDTSSRLIERRDLSLSNSEPFIFSYIYLDELNEVDEMKIVNKALSKFKRKSETTILLFIKKNNGYRLHKEYHFIGDKLLDKSSYEYMLDHSNLIKKKRLDLPFGKFRVFNYSYTFVKN